jgi:hypothetical protein
MELIYLQMILQMTLQMIFIVLAGVIVITGSLAFHGFKIYFLFKKNVGFSKEDKKGF